MTEKYGRAEELDTAATGITQDPTPVKLDKYGRAEEEYVTDEHLTEYNNFVNKVQQKFSLKTKEEAEAKAQELIKDYQKRESQAQAGKGME